ncbi:MAG TPA: hypothetical protein VIK31_03670, partial [Propionibacteriaceae bacterium]
MGGVLGSVRFGARWATVVACLAAVLLVPAVAFAANTATFAVTPKAGSRSAATRPAIVAKVYDRYGVRGSTKYSMTLDGRRVTTKLVYAKRGDYRKFTLTRRTNSVLSVGTHRVTVRTTDLKKRVSTYSWTFTITPPPPAQMPVTIAAGSCGTCHAPLAHPMTACGRCHGDGAPLGGVAYAPSDSAHTLSCSLASPCHRGGGAFPHVLGPDCAACHNPGF